MRFPALWMTSRRLPRGARETPEIGRSLCAYRMVETCPDAG